MALPKNSPSLVADPAGDLQMIEEALKSQEDKGDVTMGLSKHIDDVWARVQQDMKSVRSEIIDIMRRVKGEYEPNKLTAIRAFNGSETYLRPGENKARSAVSWIEDIYRGDTDLPWVLDPSAIAELPDETVEKIQLDVAQQAAVIQDQLAALNMNVPPEKVAELVQNYYTDQLDKAMAEMQKTARDRCDRAAKLIRDQNQEGGWEEAFKEFLYYFVRTKFGCIKGPVLTKKASKEWRADPITGAIKLTPIDKIVTDVYCVSPFNIFFERGMKCANDGNIIELHELSLSSLHDLIGVPGYNNDKVRAVISGLEAGRIKHKWFAIDDETAVDRVTKQIKEHQSSTPSTQESHDGRGKPTKVYAQEFYGTVSGKLLLDWGLQQELDPQRQYQCNCWKIDKYVIKAVINADPMGRKPYHISSWAKNPEWIIGEGLLEFAGPLEDAMNAICRAMINNIAIASGPMCEIDRDRVDMKTPIYPWRQIESTSDQMRNNGKAVEYYQPNMHANELVMAYQFFGKLLDEFTVPAYAQGASQSGVTTGTATVFTQLLAAASRSIKSVVANIDDDIIKPYIEMCYDHNMVVTDDPEIKGDAFVVANGVSGLQAREQEAQRKVEFLQVTANPVMQQILGQKNIGALLAQVAKANNIKLPDSERLEGEVDLGDVLQQMLMGQAGADPMEGQENGNIENGGGAPANPQGLNPDGSKAGTVL